MKKNNKKHQHINQKMQEIDWLQNKEIDKYLMLLCIVRSQIGGIHNWSASFYYRLNWIDLLKKNKNKRNQFST